jgi:two-component system nitrogen regulation sensor histidine kinase NtrY
VTVQTEPVARQWWRGLIAWAERHGLGNKLAVALAIAAILAGAATYGALTTSAPPLGADPGTVNLLLTLDLVLLLLLGTVVSRRIVGIWMERRRGLAGSRLHVRLVFVFSLLAVLPAIVMAVFSALFFYLGVQSWFSDRVRTAVNESLAVAEAYLHEHQQTIRADALAIKVALVEAGPLVSWNPLRLQQTLATLAVLRSLTEAVVFDGEGRVLAGYGPTFSFQFESLSPDLQRARGGDEVVLGGQGDRVTALTQISPAFDTFLFIGRPVEPRVLAHMAQAQSAVRAYTELEGRRFGLQTLLSLIFVVVALLLMMAAVWAGLNFAGYLVQPISALIGAAERVRAGDLSARVQEGLTEDELTILSRSFNRMTQQLASQRGELVEANRQLDLRRRFTEAVLAGVSAGVLGLDQEGLINLPNLSAAHLLGVGEPEELIGRRLVEVAPEMADLIATIRRRPGRTVEGQIQLRRKGVLKTLLVRMAAEQSGGAVGGYVVTFDDVSELLSAQRKAAWADVARRIAHEIKNPLTPIQLSAERLRRKYVKEIQSDPETFRAMTDTIVRHVEDIGRMVDEFSAFARMPSPVMKDNALQDLCRQAVFLQATAQAGIRFETALPPEPLVVSCDARQISQALTNLLKNAVEAIEGRAEDEGARAEDLPPGEIAVRLGADDEKVTIAVEDNGKGLPMSERERLTEPYVTTRTKGTGLGLAIVKKIMEDHGGALVLDDRPGGGARVSLILPRVTAADARPAERAETAAVDAKG